MAGWMTLAGDVVLPWAHRDESRLFLLLRRFLQSINYQWWCDLLSVRLASLPCNCLLLLLSFLSLQHWSLVPFERDYNCGPAWSCWARYLCEILLSFFSFNLHTTSTHAETPANILKPEQTSSSRKFRWASVPPREYSGTEASGSYTCV